MINADRRHDDNHTPSNGQSSSDDISSVATENLLPVYKSNQQPTIKNNIVRVSRIKIDNHNSLPNLKIKYLYRPRDNVENLLNSRKKITASEHVRISRVKYPSVPDLNTKIPLLRLDSSSRQKHPNNVNGSSPNKNITQNVNGNLINRETRKLTSRQSIVRANRTPTAAHINQGLNQKVIASKPMVTRLPLQKNQKEMYVPDKHVSEKVKKY
ncbi:unnamed protein product [Rotaria sp. Silwood1]|nr:unnamed protein product [Rotaria sp. Silwood1]CAF0747359.1 unnamed protein product [Rotaria sp. Silwood1]CAF0803755.1 unnamed protein product [Rotaria sp. Silwood1]CAF3335496.1 unnamed protein product [Rotaria sp. Silwood1]CAF3356212.1 unnamed protein product [Rotaria sp. Silwood1]